jgi:hypothetical protein
LIEGIHKKSKNNLAFAKTLYAADMESITHAISKYKNEGGL